MKYNVAIVGAAGYTGGELIRLLNGHPLVNRIIPISSSQSGKPVIAVHTDLIGEFHGEFVSAISGAEDVIFLCLPHGESGKWLNTNKIPPDTLVIDLGHDHRLLRQQFAYGLSEVFTLPISKTKRIANPGCFATLIQLMLVPFAENNLLPETVEIAATTGSTGAGQSSSPQTHFSWRSGNHSAYKTLNHQHLAEISATLSGVQSAWDGIINFIPLRGSFTRGIHAVIHFESSLDETGLKHVVQNRWQKSAFVHVVEQAPDVKQIVNTNKCFIHLEKVNGRVVLTGVLDNLLKGASGQAVQNMNIALGIPETTGLKLKALAY